MNENIRFLVSDSLKTIASAAGIPNMPPTTQHCALLVGDIISFPEAPGLAFRIASRWYDAANNGGQGTWYLRLEAERHPLDV